MNKFVMLLSHRNEKIPLNPILPFLELFLNFIFTQVSIKSCGICKILKKNIEKKYLDTSRHGFQLVNLKHTYE